MDGLSGYRGDGNPRQPLPPGRYGLFGLLDTTPHGPWQTAGIVVEVR